MLNPGFKIGGTYSPILNWIQLIGSRVVRILRKFLTVERLLNLAEIVLIIAWALWLTKPYADFNPEVWPTGADFSRNIQLFSTWQNLPVCGDCVFWNGSLNGGAPAFADIFTPVLNPFLMVSTILWDVVNGAKAMLIFSFILAGLAQLWLGRVLGLSRLARVWTAAMAVAGGHLSTRMEMGHVVMVIPIAAASLMLPAALDVARTGRRRSVVLLALTMALTLVSGHGYIQLAVAFGFLPALLIYWFDAQVRLRPVWKSFLWAAGLTVLLTAVFWLPLLHFWPEVLKESDLTFSGEQTLGNSLLNLVISDREYLGMNVLGKGSLPAMYGMYIGWIPILLVFFAFRLTPRRELRTLVVLVSAIFLIYLASSAEVFRWLADYTGAFFSMGRNLALLQPIAIPMLLALAGWGLDGLLRLPWPRITVSQSNHPDSRASGLSLVIILAFPLLWGLNSVRVYSADWITTKRVADSDYSLQTLFTSDARWVAMRHDDFHTFPEAILARLKIIMEPSYTAWNWSDRVVPPGAVELTRDEAFRSDPAYTRDLGLFVVLEHPDRYYAYVQTQGGMLPCNATALGGQIDVVCETALPGILVVNESYYPGWQAVVNGQAVVVQGKPIFSSFLVPFPADSVYLSVPTSMYLPIPAGTSLIKLRYRPWDVYLGLVLTFSGILLCGYIWWRPVKNLPEAVPLEDLLLPEAP